MNINIIAAAAVLVLAAAPAFAADQYSTSPALSFGDRAPIADTGAAQYPHFNGLAAAPEQELMVNRPGAEAEPESVNSETTTYGAH